MANYFSSETALRKLQTFFSLEYDLLRHAIGYSPRIPDYHAKCAFIRHLYEDLKRIRAMRERIQDFGIPQPERQRREPWTNLVRHLMTAENANVFFGAFYRVLKPAQLEAYTSYVNATLRLNDAPSVDVFEDHMPALARQIAWGKQMIEASDVSSAEEAEVERFEAAIREHLNALGPLYEARQAGDSLPVYPEYAMPADMALESRFVWRSAERMYETVFQKEEHPAHHSYTHFTELPVIDVCAAIVYDGRQQPFDFVADFVRQTWDEVRHSQMGFSRLRAMKVDPYAVPIPVGHYRAYAAVPLLERIAALTQVGEACSFAPKKQWTKMAAEHGDLLTALEHDYDVVDEKNHVKFGVKWMKELMAATKEPRDFKQVVQDAEWAVRLIMNELKKEKGEKWQEDLGPKFEGCQTSDSPLNLAPNIILS